MGFPKSFLRQFFFLGFLVLSQMAGADEAALQAKYDAIDQTSDRAKDFLTADERADLLERVASNPIAALAKEHEYDPSGDIGFCFGRAMPAHLTARKLGLKEGGIRKLFVIGDLRSGDTPEWRFHVTTLVIGEDNHWYAIDPIMNAPIGPGTPMKPQDWIATVQSVWDKTQKAHFYIVERNSIMPNMTVMPASSAEENGDRIIELGFKPEGKTGFEISPFADKTAYRVSLAAQENYFLHANTDATANRFHFAQLDMTVLKNGTSHPRLFDFHNYFGDLLTNLSALLPVTSPEHLQAARAASLSLRVDRL